MCQLETSSANGDIVFESQKTNTIQATKALDLACALQGGQVSASFLTDSVTQIGREK
jgi:hypothetical protein